MTYLISKKSLKPATVKRKVKTIISLLKHGCDLADADNVVRFLNTCGWASGTKDIVIDSYRDYLNMLGLTEVKLPHIRREEKLPFIPLESELDALICNAKTKICAFLFWSMVEKGRFPEEYLSNYLHMIDPTRFEMRPIPFNFHPHFYHGIMNSLGVLKQPNELLLHLLAIIESKRFHSPEELCAWIRTLSPDFFRIHR
jgi:hypothetical protein